MTPAQKNRLLGYSALLKTHGEALTFRSGTVTALVVRGQPDAYGGDVDFTAREASRVVLRKSDLTPIPAAGETFTDSNGYHHAIEVVELIGLIVVCTCNTAEQ